MFEGLCNLMNGSSSTSNYPIILLLHVDPVVRVWGLFNRVEEAILQQFF